MRVRICRKEAKETKYWLELILHNNPEFKSTIDPLISESTEFIRMFSAMIKNSI